MALYWNPRAPLVDNNGAPLLNAAIYYGDPNVDPKANPKAIYLQEDFSVAAQNPQRTNDLGVASQGTIYMQGEYSILIEDSDGGQIHNIPSVWGIAEQLNLNNLGPLTSSGPIEIASTGNALFIANQGSAASTLGGLVFRENNADRFSFIRRSEADGGALQLINNINGLVQQSWERDGSVIQYLAGVPAITMHFVGGLPVFDLNVLVGRSSQVAVAVMDVNMVTAEVLGDSFGVQSVTSTDTGQTTVVLSEQEARDFNLVASTNSSRLLAQDAYAVVNAIGQATGGAGTVRQVVVELNAVTASTGIGALLDSFFTMTVLDSGRLTNPT